MQSSLQPGTYELTLIIDGPGQAVVGMGLGADVEVTATSPRDDLHISDLIDFGVPEGVGSAQVSMAEHDAQVHVVLSLDTYAHTPPASAHQGRYRSCITDPPLGCAREASPEGRYRGAFSVGLQQGPVIGGFSYSLDVSAGDLDAEPTPRAFGFEQTTAPGDLTAQSLQLAYRGTAEIPVQG